MKLRFLFALLALLFTGPLAHAQGVTVQQLTPYGSPLDANAVFWGGEGTGGGAHTYKLTIGQINAYSLGRSNTWTGTNNFTGALQVNGVAAGVTLGSTPVTLGATASTLADVTLTGATLNSPTINTPTISGGAASFTTVSASGQITAGVSQGTAPFVVTSTTVVPNLNASLLNGGSFTSPPTIGGGTPGAGNFSSIGATTRGTGAFTTLNTTGQITSTLATGTAPFSVASTTVVPNLNASALGGATFAAPGAIGSGTPGTGAFTTLSAGAITGSSVSVTGQLTSTASTGTAPLSVASTTTVANLDATSIAGGLTFASPGPIGGTSASTVKLTGLTTTNLLVSSTAPTISSGFGTSPTITANGTAAFRITVGSGGTASTGVIGLPTAATGWVCNATDITTKSTSVFLTKQTAGTTTSATLTQYNTAGTATAWVAADQIYVSCFGF